MAISTNWEALLASFVRRGVMKPCPCGGSPKLDYDIQSDYFTLRCSGHNCTILPKMAQTRPRTTRFQLLDGRDQQNAELLRLADEWNKAIERATA